MKKQLSTYIALTQFCKVHDVERTFLEDLSDIGLIEIVEDQGQAMLSEDMISIAERLLRLRNDLSLNVSGLEAVFHLSSQLQELRSELLYVKRRLRFYEKE
ncbi:MAG: hypothetical protein KDD62_00640 [Bdellovibrionales bacterium]|nr:hypothetical protein [Bdellovibrionales bacterium]